MPSRFSRLEFDENERRRQQTHEELSGTPKRTAGYYLDEAHTAYRRGEFEQALRLYTRCLGEDRAVVAAWVGQARMLVQLGEYSEARLWSDKALELFRNQGELLACKAQACARLRDFKAAYGASDASLKSPGSSAWRWEARGEVLLARREGLYTECFARALTEPDHDWFDYVIVGEICLFYRHAARALTYLQKAIELKADHAYAWYVLGQCHHALGWTGQAENSFERCVELDPRCEIGRRALEYLLRENALARLWRRIGGWRQR
jgi:tetratricopeptide (TPR) repeat protein